MKNIEHYLKPGAIVPVNMETTRLLVNALREVLAQPEQQEPVAHLWECLGRWSAYLVNNGTQADCAPPQWLVDAIKKATTPPQRTWVGLTEDDLRQIILVAVGVAEAKLKEKNT